MIKNIVRLCERRLCKEVIIGKRSFSSNLCELSLKRWDRKNVDKLWIRRKSDKRTQAAAIFTPVSVRTESNDLDDIGTELGGRLDRREVASLLTNFSSRTSVKKAALSLQLEETLLHQALLSFRRFCVSPNLPTDLHLVLGDIIQGAGHVDDLLPYFLRHAKQVFPHLDCIDDLKKISDLRTPANWYPQARAINRRVIFHAGPTNSGKTYHALERFLSAKSGVYCGPLKLLAAEIYHKSNTKGTPCDLVTGEERRSAKSFNSIEESPSPRIRGEGDSDASHVACTVEMTSLVTPYEVAIIDEVQLVGDKQRGWAWTRAILGLQVEELHLCGEAGAIPLIEEICHTTGEEIEIRKYKRLTELKVENHAVCSLDNIQPGDCIVCFSKNDIYSVSRAIENRGMEVAVIYGSLPPGTKLAQANKFNDPNNPCKVMVATDAIGLGINLSIRRIVFYSLIKPMMNDKGEKEMDVISISQCLQIAGRAGRYGSAWETGYVTTFKAEDLSTLQSLMVQLPDTVDQAGLHPTAEQMELYAYHLPHASLSSLMDIFVHLCTVDDSLYFMCNTEAFKFLAEMIQHVPLPLRARYVFCCAPINQKVPFVCAMFLKMVRQYSKNEAVTWSWLCNAIGWPLQSPKTIIDLVHLEGVFDVLDVYLWLSYRFEDMFPDAHIVRDMQKELDFIIQQGILQITRLLQNSETTISSNTPDEDLFETKRKRQSKSYSKKTDTVDEMQYIPTQGRLTDKLVAQGLLTPKMLKQLKEELGRQEIKGIEKLERLKRKGGRKPKM